MGSGKHACICTLTRHVCVVLFENGKGSEYISVFVFNFFTEKKKKSEKEKKKKKPGSECLLSDKFFISVEHFV